MKFSPLTLAPSFEKTIELVCKGGWNSLNAEEKSRMRNSPMDKDLYSHFQRCVFSAWKAAQEEIVKMQKSYWTDPAFHQNPQKRYEYRNLQRLLDVIIWHRYTDIADIRSIYHEEPIIQDFSTNNLESCLAAAAHFNKDSDKFALVTDLTSGTRIGDLYICEVLGSHWFSEVKSGGFNEQIFETLSSADKPCDLAQIIDTQSKQKQVERVLRQLKRSSDVANFVHAGEGHDDRYQATRSVIASNYVPVNFAEQLNELLSRMESSELGVECSIVDDCLMLTAVDAERLTAEEILKLRLADRCLLDGSLDEPGIEIDFATFLNNTSYSKPIYIQPLPPESILTLLRKKVIVYFYFSFSKFAKRFTSTEYEVDVVDIKRSSKLWAKHRKYALKKDNFSVTFKDNASGNKVFISGGMFQRVPSLLFSPEAIFQMHIELLNHPNISF